VDCRRPHIAFCHRVLPSLPAASRPAIPAPPRNPHRSPPRSQLTRNPRPAIPVRNPLEGARRWKVLAAGKLSGPLPLEGARPAAENGRSSRPHARTPAGRSLIERTRMEGHRIWMEDADGRSVAKSRGSATSSSVTVNGMSEISAQVRQWKADLPFMDFPSALKNSRRQ
jgi:hypothetical protein